MRGCETANKINYFNSRKKIYKKLLKTYHKKRVQMWIKNILKYFETR